MAFDSPVAVPPTSAYGPPEIDFSWLANLPNTFYKGKQNAFDDQQRQLVTQQQQAFKGELPMDANGNPDYRAITKRLAELGDIGAIGQLGPLVQGQTTGQVNPLTAQLLGMPPQGGAQPPPQGAPQPQQPPPQRTPATQPGGDQPGSIVGLVTAKIPQEQAGPTIARVAQTMGIDPNAPLTPGQAIRVNGLVQRYAQAGAAPSGSPSASVAPAAAPAPAAGSPAGRVDTGFSALPPSAGNVSPAPQPRPQGAPQGPSQAQGQPQPQQPPPPQRPPMPPPAAPPPAQPAQQPLVPQVPLPVNPTTGKPFANEQDAILAIDRAMAAERNPQARAALEDYRTRLENQSKPVAVRPGETLLDPRNAQTIFQGASTNPTAVALQRYLAENPNATAEQIQALIQSGRGGGRSAIAMYMNKYLAEHPDATAEEVKRATQLYTTETTAQNRFLSGPQGNTIRSLNVVVSHIQTMQDLGDALGNGNIKAFNSLAQRWAEETGSPAPTNFDTAKQIVGAEVIKALGVAGAGSQAERQEAADAFNRARSPQQLAGAISAVRKLMVGQLSGLRRQFVAASGLPGEKFDEMLEPETKAFFGKGETSKADTGTPASSGNVVQWVRRPDGSLGPAQ